MRYLVSGAKGIAYETDALGKERIFHLHLQIARQRFRDLVLVALALVVGQGQIRRVGAYLEDAFVFRRGAVMRA